MKKLITIMLLIFSVTSLGNESEFSINFGLIMKNELGEPIAFKPTNEIPLNEKKEGALYGLVVTKKDEIPFTLGAIHIFPEDSQGKKAKMMSKAMNVMTRGAIFLRTNEEDIAGEYVIEVYLNNIHTDTIAYSLVKP